MMLLKGNTIVSCYADAVGLLTICLLIILSERIRDKRNKSLRVFFRLCLYVAATCAFSFVCHYAYGQTEPYSHTLMLICRTAKEWFLFLIATQWVAYVRCELYGEIRRNKAGYHLTVSLIVLYTLLLIFNIFAPILFSCTAENDFEPEIAYYVVVGVEFAYLLASVYIVRKFDRQSKKTRFLHLMPIILPVAASVGVRFILPYEIDTLGLVFGLTILYFSMSSEIRFVDNETGLYNKGYLGYLIDMALAGKSNARSALILKMRGDRASACRIMRSALHKEGDVMRMEADTYLMLSSTDSLSTLQYLSGLVDEAVSKHNKLYPGSKISLSVRSRIRGQNEDAFTFLRTVMDENEASSEMRGIVSMITELDRLDEELKLAADIQLHSLPRRFPPFPEYSEFSLYASMDPAKEVGGDFYDFFLIDRDRLALVIADVSGKGIPAALSMMVSKTLIKNQLLSGSGPAAALEQVNKQLSERNESMMFVTVWAAVLEISTGKGVACNAGHENPGLMQPGGSFELLKYRHDMPLGVTGKAVYHDREFRLEPGGCLFVYTDGVPEATNAGGEMFGGERLALTLNEAPDADPETLIDHVNQAIAAFVDGEPQFDDTTMLCLRYTGRKDREEGEPPAAQEADRENDR